MSDTATAVSVAPLVALLAPLVQVAVTALLGVIGSWVVYLAGKYLHVQISQAAVNTVISKAQTVAGTMIANDAQNLAGKSITVSDPRIRDAAISIAAKLPSVLTAAGWDTDRVKTLVVGEIGKLQAASPPPSTATATAVSPDGASMTVKSAS